MSRKQVVKSDPPPGFDFGKPLLQIIADPGAGEPE